MDNYDLFENQKVQPKFNKEDWAQQKNDRRKTAYETIGNVAIKIATDPTMFQSYLDVQSRFDKYSSNNALLILSQKPQATQIRDSGGWKELKSYINKGEKGITILEPGDKYERENGTQGTNYNPKVVFDVSQTNYSKSTKDKPINLRNAIKALLDYAPARVVTCDRTETGEVSFYDPNKNEIQMVKGLTADKIIIHLSQELAHAQIATNTPDYNRTTANFHAYCTSYMMAKKFGIDTKEFNFSSIPDVYKGLEAQDITSDLSSLQSIHKPMSERVNNNLYRQEQKKNQSER